MDEVIGFALAAVDEYPKEKKENEGLRREYDWVVNNLNHVSQLTCD
jgi:hypothetical protein